MTTICRISRVRSHTPRLIDSYDVNYEADSELKAQCLSRGFTDCVTSDGKKWRLPKTILLALDDTIYSVDKNFDEAVIATKAEMEKQEKGKCHRIYCPRLVHDDE